MRLFSDSTDMNGPAMEPEKFLVPEDAAEIGGELANVTVDPRMNDQRAPVMAVSRFDRFFVSAAELIA